MNRDMKYYWNKTKKEAVVVASHFLEGLLSQKLELERIVFKKTNWSIFDDIEIRTITKK